MRVSHRVTVRIGLHDERSDAINGWKHFCKGQKIREQIKVLRVGVRHRHNRSSGNPRLALGNELGLGLGLRFSVMVKVVNRGAKLTSMWITRPLTKATGEPFNLTRKQR